MTRVPIPIRRAVATGLLLLAAGAATVTTPASRPAVAAPIVIPWSQIEGSAFPLRNRLPPGFYIHRRGNEVIVASHGINQTGLVFSGRVLLERGIITHPRAILHERPGNRYQDVFQQQTPNILDFRHITAGHLDGVRFFVNGGRSLDFDLRLQGRPTPRVFFGPRAAEVIGYPILCDLSR
ncbi:MAG: hypothetical protein K0Q72_4004 [Armatimonadetes bacterium]|jgi:hypothetical protein|nr:hypothetical protein [Armatimonadota bacterium]